MNLQKNLNYHPIFNTSEFSIQTPMIDHLVETIHQWLWNGETGGLVLGDNRTGKTFAINNSIPRLVNRLNETIPARCISIRRRDQPTVASVFNNLCFALQLKPKPRATADEMSDLVYHHLYELAQENITKQVVLFVDEFQRLSLRQLEAFAEIYDRMSQARVNICIVFVGNRNSAENIVERAFEANHELIRGRFFIQIHEYYGIRNKQQLQMCLNQYDQLTYPVIDGTSYARYFIDDKEIESWTLESCVDEIWRVYVEKYRREFKTTSWPMQYFVSAMRILLVDYIPRYGFSPDVLPELIDRSIEGSGLINSLVRA